MRVPVFYFCIFGAGTVCSLFSACGDSNEDPRSDLGQASGPGNSLPLESSDEDGGASDPSASEPSRQSSGGRPSTDEKTEEQGTNANRDDEGVEEGSEIRFDVPMPDGSGIEGGSFRPEHSYIWIANTDEGTVSKIDTQTIIEQARYPTAPSYNNPSRTSVNLNGDAAIAGRNGGITKIYANPDHCKDKNASGTIETSTDATPLPFAQEECIAWHVKTPYGGQRGTAWTQGVWNPELRKFSGQDLWVASLNKNPGTGNGEAILYDGDTGEQIGVAEIPAARLNSAVSYGGVVDSNGDFWFHGQNSHLRKAERESFRVVDYEMTHGAYGITYGGKPDGPGYVWTCNNIMGRFDPRTESWSLAKQDDLASTGLVSRSNYGGCMVDGNGLIWHSGRSTESNSAVVFGMDTESMDVVAAIEVPRHCHGIAIDFEGYVWGVGLVADEAYKIDVAAETFETFNQLVGAYTYSDMTGFALASTLQPPVQ